LLWLTSAPSIVTFSEIISVKHYSNKAEFYFLGKHI
jgi:hypothetical protein